MLLEFAPCKLCVHITFARCVLRTNLEIIWFGLRSRCNPATHLQPHQPPTQGSCNPSKSDTITRHVRFSSAWNASLVGAWRRDVPSRVWPNGSHHPPTRSSRVNQFAAVISSDGLRVARSATTNIPLRDSTSKHRGTGPSQILSQPRLTGEQEVTTHHL